MYMLNIDIKELCKTIITVQNEAAKQIYLKFLEFSNSIIIQIKNNILYCFRIILKE